MQFLVIGRDGNDADALNRRMAARPAHIALGDKTRDAGNLLYAAAICDDAEKMVGSAMILEFDSRAALDHWLKEEPYVTGKVWATVEVEPCKIGPSFAKATCT